MTRRVPTDPTAGANKTARAALAKVLEPGEEVIQALSGLGVLYQTNRRLLVWTASITGKGVWTCPLESVHKVSYGRAGKSAIVSIESYDDLSRQGNTHRRKVVVDDSPAAAAFPAEVIQAVNALIADPYGRQPLEVALERATSGWTIPVVVRIYPDDSAGLGLRQAEIALFARYGYAPTASIGAKGALKTKDLILTGGLGAAFRLARGKGGLHQIGTTTVSFAKVATAPAAARPPVYQGPPAYQVPAPVETRICPGCEKEVKATARICRYCRYEFDKDVGSDVPMERPSMTGAGSTTTSEGPEHPDQVTPTTTPDSPRPLWEQPSFLVTLGVCAVWLTGLTSSSAKLQADRGGVIVLLILTVLGYAGYRKRRGWKALPTSGWLPSRQISRRRAIGLGAYLAVLVLVVAASALPQTTGDSSVGLPGGADAPWTKSQATTTCGDWLSVMTDPQRKAYAEAMLASDLLKPHGPALYQTTANDYISLITGMCQEEGSSSLIEQ